MTTPTTMTRTGLSVGNVVPEATAVSQAVPQARTVGKGWAAGSGTTAGRVLARLTGGTDGREAGLATAEYAIATVAAAGFAGLLIVVLRSGEVREMLLGIVRSALSLG